MDGAEPSYNDDDLRMLEETVSDLEGKLASERSSFFKMKLQSQIKTLKETYNKHRKPLDLRAKEKSCMQVHVDRKGAAISSKKLSISNLIGDRIRPGDCVEALVADCKNTVLDYFECQNSVVLENLHECIVCCLAQQIRVTNCSKVKLSCFSYSGVFLQDSSDIEITEYKHPDISNSFNKFDNVYDFSDPCSSRNYTLIK